MRQFIPLIMILFATGCSNSSQNSTRKLLNAHHRVMQEEFQLHLLDDQIHPEKYGKLRVDYCVYEEIDVLKARFLIHKVSENLVNKLNQNLLLRAFMPNHTISSEDLDISISCLSPKTKKRFSFDHLTNATLLNGKIHYSQYFAKSDSISSVLLEPLNSSN